LGYTFTSGATEAWIADEVGEERAGDAYLRGSQAARAGALVAIPISVALGTVTVRLPIVLGGLAMLGLAFFLAQVMTEEGFAPVPPDDRTTWRMMRHTLEDAQQVVRRQPVLLVLLAIGLFYGLYSEGFDRLWTPHLLENYQVGFLEGVEPVVWFGAIRGVVLVSTLVATEVVRRRVDTNRSAPLGRALMGTAGLIVAAMATFGFTGSFWLTLACFWLIGVLRSITHPLLTTWINLRIDDRRVRATLFSVSSQVDAIGQIAGGPAVGAIGNASIRAALVTSSLILTPVLPLYAAAIRRGHGEAATARGHGRGR
jgi:DHA3 family tetracycline resistance protein-like MFS transporter